MSSKQGDHMDDETRKMLRMTAAMEGQEVIAANIGKKVTLSQMELICLVNFAEIGLMSVFSGLDGDDGDEAQESLERHLDRIRELFNRDGNKEGLSRLSMTTAAMLRGKRFFQYIA